MTEIIVPDSDSEPLPSYDTLPTPHHESIQPTAQPSTTPTSASSSSNSSTEDHANSFQPTAHGIVASVSVAHGVACGDSTTSSNETSDDEDEEMSDSFETIGPALFAKSDLNWSCG